MLMWTRIDGEFDVMTPVNQPDNAVYIALDTFCLITFLMSTLVITLMDTKLLLFAMRTQDHVQRSFQSTQNRSSRELRNENYYETLTRALNEMFHSYVTAMFDYD